MLPKMALAFLLGGAAVGTVVYMAVKPAATPASAAVSVPVHPVPQVEPTPSAPEKIEAPLAPVPVMKTVKPKPAPQAKKIPKPAPVAIAKALPPSPPAPAPAPAPDPPKITEPAKVEPAPEPKVEIAEPAPPPVVQPEPAKPAPRTPQVVTIPAGTLINVRLREALNTEKDSLDDAFVATLDTPLIVDGFVIAERGTSQRGRIVDLQRAGRVKGRAMLALELNQLSTADGQKVDIRTDTFRHEQQSGVKGDATKAGVAAGIGAAIGAIAGGGTGAAIGAATAGRPLQGAFAGGIGYLRALAAGGRFPRRDVLRLISFER